MLEKAQAKLFSPQTQSLCVKTMAITYILTVVEYFEIFSQAALKSKNEIGLCFRRYTPSGYKAGFEVCSWEEDLPKKYLNGGYTGIYLTVNNSTPKSSQDWEFIDREQENILIIEGGRIKNNKLEASNLRILSKKTNCKNLYKKIRNLIKSQSHQGIYVGETYYKNDFYSDAAAKYIMVSSFDGYEYTTNNT